LHDATVSICRCFYREELALLASLAPGLPDGCRVETASVPPGHTYVRIMRDLS
jgi:hypothetical protein